MPNVLGIDHPLILVRDIETAIRRFSALGFTMTPVGKHPWGTSTSIAIMDRSLIELMSIYDETLADLMPAGDFRFGRYIQHHLAEREGVSLLALYSEDAEKDVATVESRGIVCQGTINFGRDVILPDGGRDRTATTLKIIQDPDLPRLSNFICHQHRPDLIYVPKWCTHANGASGYTQVTILADLADQPRVRKRLAGLYGETALFNVEGGFGARTGKGAFVVYDQSGVEQRFGRLPPELAAEKEPFYAAIHVRVPDLDRLASLLDSADVSYRRLDHEVRLLGAEDYGNAFLNFTDGDDLV